MSVKTEAEWDVKTDWNTEGEGTTILSLEKESFYPMLRDMETGIVSIIKSCPFYIGSAEGVNQLKISDKQRTCSDIRSFLRKRGRRIYSARFRFNKWNVDRRKKNKKRQPGKITRRSNGALCTKRI